MYEKIVPSTDDSGPQSLNSLEGYRKFQPMHNVYFVSSEDSGESNALISIEFKLYFAAVSAELMLSHYPYISSYQRICKRIVRLERKKNILKVEAVTSTSVGWVSISFHDFRWMF